MQQVADATTQGAADPSRLSAMQFFTLSFLLLTIIGTVIWLAGGSKVMGKGDDRTVLGDIDPRRR